MQAGFIRVLGAMPGSGLRGVRAAVLVTDGQRLAGIGETAERPYGDDERAILRAAEGAGPDTPEARAAAEVVETAHAQLLCRFARVDLIGFHGQTLFHEPGGRGTHQAGSGAVLAEVLAEAHGCPVVWDFRSADLRMGGQGGPLAPFYLHALARKLGEAGPVAFLHLAERARITWCNPAEAAPEDGCLAIDGGPGPGAILALVSARLGAPSAPGQVVPEALERLIGDPWIARPTGAGATAPPPPLDGLCANDAAATLGAALAARIGIALDHLPKMPARLWVTGAGRRDAAMMAMLEASCDCPVAPVEAAGLDGDMIPAQSIAFLAVRVSRGMSTTTTGTTGVPAPVGGGTISRPGELIPAQAG